MYILQLSSLYSSDPLILANSVKVNILTRDYDKAAEVFHQLLRGNVPSFISLTQAHRRLASIVDDNDVSLLTSTGLLHQYKKEYDRAIEW